MRLPRRIGWLVLVFGIVTCLAAASYPAIRDAYAPMNEVESQCLLCARHRDEKWVCSEKVTDSITSNQYSDWIDSFFPATHTHVWHGSTVYHRAHWFGPKGIGCGGAPILSTIYTERSKLGETNAQRLVLKWHQRVQSPTFDMKQLSAMDDFIRNVIFDPQSLLDE